MGKRGGGEDDAGGGAGGEITMSIEETNKLRISLGLKPLAVGNEKPKPPSEEDTKRKEEAAAAKTAELAERVKAARERRTQQEILAATKTLGEAEPDVDDVMAWVNKSRTLTTEQQQQAKKQAAKKKQQVRRKPMAADSDDEQEEDVGDIAGMKVAHGVAELDAGDSIILTLEDKSILDEKGNLVEDDDAALENVLLRETKKRSKAYDDSRKTAKPLWEEDGKKRGMLDKYDEDEEEIITLGAAGTIDTSALQQKKEDIGAKLAAGAALLAEGAKGPSTASDYLTAEELEAMKKPKKKKERKLKKKTLTGEELAALEADAAARGNDGKSELGSRKEREARAAKKAEEEANEAAGKRSRFDHALAKANYASLALRPSSNDKNNNDGLGGDNDDDDDDLYRSLSKARQLAQRSSSSAPARPENIAEELIKRREQREKAGASAAPIFAGGASLTLNDMEEFTRHIAVKHEQAPQEVSNGGEQPSSAAAVKVEDEKDYKVAIPMDEDVKAEEDTAGAWAAATNGDVEMKDEDDDRKPPPAAVKKELPVEDALTVEKSIGRGLAGVLGLMKERGELTQKEMFAGRTNDTRDSYFSNAMGGFKDVYTGGKQEDKLALDVEIALTKRDEYGRILTPKEAFRQMCHRFHGIYPSRNTKEKRAKQAEKEIAQVKAATGATESKSLNQIGRVHEKLATPYVVLSGNVKPGQSRDAGAGYATVEPTDPWDVDDSVPKLGTGQEPLTGRAKVEMMLGMKRKEGPVGGFSSMPPPPNKAPKRQ